MCSSSVTTLKVCVQGYWSCTDHLNNNIINNKSTTYLICRAFPTWVVSVCFIQKERAGVIQAWFWLNSGWFLRQQVYIMQVSVTDGVYFSLMSLGCPGLKWELRRRAVVSPHLCISTAESRREAYGYRGKRRHPEREQGMEWERVSDSLAATVLDWDLAGWWLKLQCSDNKKCSHNEACAAAGPTLHQGRIGPCLDESTVSSAGYKASAKWCNLIRRGTDRERGRQKHRKKARVGPREGKGGGGGGSDPKVWRKRPRLRFTAPHSSNGTKPAPPLIPCPPPH